MSKQGPRVTADYVLDRPESTAADQVWVVLLRDGNWAYLATSQDVFTKRVVGFGAAPATRSRFQLY